MRKNRSRLARIDYKGSTRPSDHKLERAYGYRHLPVSENGLTVTTSVDQFLDRHARTENRKVGFSAHYPYPHKVQSLHYTHVRELAMIASKH